jgi:hypothetical protein
MIETLRLLQAFKHQRQPTENSFPRAALLWPAAGKMKSVKDATQEDDTLRGR